MDTLKRRAIFILGMHRSGTSVLTRAVHLQGAVLPKTLMPAQADNPDGFFESLPVVRFNNELLQDASRSWDDPRPIAPAWWKRRGRTLRVKQAKTILKREFPEGEVLVLKDPRISRLLPIWLEAASEIGLEPAAFVGCRNPIEVAASLFKRNKMGAQTAHLLWLAYMLEAETASRGLPRAMVQFDHLIADWRSALAKAYDAIELDSLMLDGEPAETLDAALSEKKRHHQATTDQLLQDESASPLLKEAWAAFSTRPLPRPEHFDGLRARLTDAWATIAPAGKLADALPAKAAARARARQALASDEPAAAQTPRNLVLHYHIFKNAGTSLDQILKQNFKTGWLEQEGPNPGWRPESIAEFIQQHPEILVLSSHTALLPPPVLPGLTVYPIVFVRHPIDRIRSIYEFERKQIAETDGARMAKQTDLAGYIKWRLNRPGDRAIRNFQAYRLAFAMPAVHEGRKLGEEERALKAVETLPFVGVVEKFDESLAKLQAWLRPVFPEIDLKPTKANITQKGETTLESRLQEIRKTIGDDLYAELLKANELDLEVYEKAVAISAAGGK
ncbi:MAG: hypothetical protein AB1591_10780 [Pseudomonadota bacterium]